MGKVRPPSPALPPERGKGVEVAMWINRFETEYYGRRGMYFYEPLKTKAPRSGVRPYCCYVNVVIFHAYPYYCLPGKNSFIEYDRCESEWDLFGQRFMEGEGWGCFAALVLHHDT